MRQVATQIENETQVGGNTASRVGGLFNDIVDHLDVAETDIDNIQSDVSDLNDDIYGTTPSTTTINPTIKGAQNATRWKLDWISSLQDGDVLSVTSATGYQFTIFRYHMNNGSTVIDETYCNYTNSYTLNYASGSNKNIRVLIKRTDDGNITGSEVSQNVTYSATRTNIGGGLIDDVAGLHNDISDINHDVNSLDGRVDAIEQDMQSSKVEVDLSSGTYYKNLNINKQVSPNLIATVSPSAPNSYGSYLIPAVQGRTYVMETSVAQKCAFGLIKNSTIADGDTVIYPNIPDSNWKLVDNTASVYTWEITESGCYFLVRNDTASGGRTAPINFYWINDNARFVERDEMLNEVLPNSESPVKSRAIYEFARNSSKEIKILFIGNSLTQDAVMWLPYVLKNIGTGVKYQLIDMYNGGYTLTQQWAKINGGQKFDTVSVCNNATGWTNYNNSKTLDSMLNVIDFDYLVLQEYYNYKASAEETDINAFNNIVDYIAARVSHPFEVVTLIHAPKRDNPTSIYNVTVQGNQKILRETCASSLINVGTAIYEALSTDLDSLGTKGHLSPDGTHAQEGLPCIMEALNLAMWVYKKLGIAGGVVNFQWTPSPSDIYSALHVAGANGSVIDGTTAQQLLASKVAANSFTKNEAVFVGANLA